ESENGGEFLYLARPDQPGVTKVNYEPTGLAFSAWSADGGWLILGDESLFRVRSSGGDAKPLCPEGWPGSPDRPRGAYLAPISQSPAALSVANIDGSGLERLATVPKSTSFLIWSSDSKEIGLSLPKDRRHLRIAVVNVATRKLHRLTNGAQADYIADVSPTGRFVAFFRLRLSGAKFVSASLWVIGASGGRARKVMTLASGPLGPCPIVAWSPTAPVLAISNEACAPD